MSFSVVVLLVVALIITLVNRTTNPPSNHQPPPSHPPSPGNKGGTAVGHARDTTTAVGAARCLWWRGEGSGAEGADRRWGRRGATVQRASAPDDGRLRGRASGWAQAGGAEIF